MSPFFVRALGPVVALTLTGVASAADFGFGGTQNKIAHFHLSGALTETPVAMPMAFSGESSTSLAELLDRLAEAREDEAVKAIILTMDGLQMGAGQMEELRKEFERFKAVKKRVFVHVEELTLGSYALLTGASDLSVVPTADLWLTGLHVETPFAKETLEWLGLEADILQMGDFKSAGEMFTRTGPSEAAKANYNWLLDGLYDSLVNMIASSRGLTAAKVRALVDDGPYTAERAKQAGLIEAVEYRDEFLARVRSIYGPSVSVDNRYAEEKGPKIDLNNPFAIFQFFAEMLHGEESKQGDAVGVVFVEGMIVTGHAKPSPFGGSDGAYSGDIAKALAEAAEDDTVKAVVLRVDSPGGSALASEIILRAAMQVKAKKTLVVSMGNVAGSGGYYVACDAETIFADETTITASIGVVGGKFVTAAMWDKLGVKWTEYKRGANSDLMASSRKFDEAQRKRVHGWMNDIYGVFKNHVVKGRGDKLKKPIDELAGGRVFTGKQALELGLVDKIGGLDDALEFAARKAGLSDYDVRFIPEPKNFLDQIIEELSGQGERPADLAVRTVLGAPLSGATESNLLLSVLAQLDPERMKLVTRMLERFELIRREGVVMMMSDEILVR